MFRRLRQEIGARGSLMIAAIALDAIVLSVSGAMKLQSDPLIVVIAAVAMAAVFASGRVFLARWTARRQHGDH